jgi:hypothetical protein
VDDSSQEPGVPGASARREYERRRAARERRTRERHPRLGGLLLALRDPPQHETAWARGAAAEERIGRRLAELCSERVLLLHDRRIPGTRANIDHLAIGPTGVWVIDTKRYAGKVWVEEPLFGRPKLRIAGRDRSKLIDGLEWQTEQASAAVRISDPEMPVHGALCFVDADLPLLRTLRFRGYPLLYPKGLAKRIEARGAVTDDRIHGAFAALRAAFPLQNSADRLPPTATDG